MRYRFAIAVLTLAFALIPFRLAADQRSTVDFREDTELFVLDLQNVRTTEHLTDAEAEFVLSAMHDLRFLQSRWTADTDVPPAYIASLNYDRFVLNRPTPSNERREQTLQSIALDLRAKRLNCESAPQGLGTFVLVRTYVVDRATTKRIDDLPIYYGGFDPDDPGTMLIIDRQAGDATVTLIPGYYMFWTNRDNHVLPVGRMSQEIHQNPTTFPIPIP